MVFDLWVCEWFDNFEYVGGMNWIRRGSYKCIFEKNELNLEGFGEVWFGFGWIKKYCRKLLMN